MSEPTKVKESAGWHTSYGYTQSEPGLWTIGFYGGGKWNPGSDHSTKKAAADCVHYLNGGDDHLRERVAELEDILRSMTNGLADHLKAGMRCDSCSSEVEQARAVLAKERP